MLVSAKQILESALHDHYAIGAFNVFNMETALGVMRAAVATNSPVIIQVSEKAFGYSERELISNIVKDLAARNPTVPVVLNLDHGHDVEIAKACVEEGYTSIMFDGSTLGYEENVALTTIVAEYAHAHRATAQGELGRLPKNAREAKELKPSDYMTDPVQAADYCAKTGVDFLAVAIGNIHGISAEEPRIDLDRLQQIHEKVALPLVLHGGSGIPVEDIRQAIGLGIAEINIDTEMRMAFSSALRNSVSINVKEIDPRVLLAPSVNAVQAVVKEKMLLFGSANKC